VIGELRHKTPVVGAALLIFFWLFMMASLRHTSQTADEGIHAVAGYTYWRFNDYRLDPENANLSQRVMAVPLLLGNYKSPPLDSDAWRTADEERLAWQWFNDPDNDIDAMDFRGRAACGVLAVLLGILVWQWSRRLFGIAGGLISLGLYVFNPSILANGALMTSDTAAALFFLAGIWAWWRLLEQVTIGRLVISGLAIGGLFVSKMSGVLIIPMALILLLGRIIHPAPLPVSFFGSRQLRSRSSRLTAFAIAILVQSILVLVTVWAFYGFRYSAFSPKMPDGRWTNETWEEVLEKSLPGALLDQINLDSVQRRQVDDIFNRDGAARERWSVESLRAINDVKTEVLTTEQRQHLEDLVRLPSPRLVARILESMRHYHLLPEAYIYGFAHSWHNSLERAAFLNGQFSLFGFYGFFPYTFLVKTPLTVFVIILIAIGATARGLVQAGARWRGQLAEGFYRTLPLWVLLAVYWATAISSHLNIGHRHILPTYPPLFILCGAAGCWFDVSAASRRVSLVAHNRLVAATRGLLILCLIVLVCEVTYRFPHYLAYFNGIVAPKQAYRHVVDSSLDWGQDLPLVRDYIESKHPPQPVYLSYCGGAANPLYYHIPAVLGYCFPGRYRQPPIRTLEFPADEADALLYDFFQREPEYDDQVFGKARVGDKVSVVVVKKPSALRLTAGTYIISATLLQPVRLPRRGTFGNWNERLERQYQMSVHLTKSLLSDDPVERSTILPQLEPRKWNSALNTYERLRFHRLAAFLRHRNPDDNIGYSMLVYHLTDNDLSLALDGPPPELEPDIVQERFGPPRVLTDQSD
jgi:hypothetical protein